MTKLGVPRKIFTNLSTESLPENVAPLLKYAEKRTHVMKHRENLHSSLFD